MSRVKQIIPAFYEANLHLPDHKSYLEVSEFFTDTIQGEGIFTGYPATFLRLKGCILQCSWCDSTEVWKHGNPFTFDELFELMEKHHVVERFAAGQHLVITGGSPLRQQSALYHFLARFAEKYQFYPYVELENEAVILPKPELSKYICCWNNSPKLRSSGAPANAYHPEVLSYLSHQPNSWFKFVIKDKFDWKEIEEFYLKPGYIFRNQVILMPEGATRVELLKHREEVIDLAIEHNVRYCTREHIIVWDKKTGI